jgi:hypothetical protein
MPQQPRTAMAIMERVLSALFPPKVSMLGDVENFPEVVKDYERVNRKGVENPRGGAMFGHVTEPAKEKRIIYLGPRTVWP